MKKNNIKYKRNTMNFKDALKQKQEELDKEMIVLFKNWVVDNIEKYTNDRLVKMRSNTIKGNEEMTILLKSPIKKIASDAKKLGLPNKYAKAEWIVEAFESQGHEFKKQSTLKHGKHTVFNGFELHGVDCNEIEAVSIDELIS